MIILIEGTKTVINLKILELWKEELKSEIFKLNGTEASYY